MDTDLVPLLSFVSDSDVDKLVENDIDTDVLLVPLISPDTLIDFDCDGNMEMDVVYETDSDKLSDDDGVLVIDCEPESERLDSRDNDGLPSEGDGERLTVGCSDSLSDGSTESEIDHVPLTDLLELLERECTTVSE